MGRERNSRAGKKILRSTAFWSLLTCDFIVELRAPIFLSLSRRREFRVGSSTGCCKSRRKEDEKAAESPPCCTYRWFDESQDYLRKCSNSSSAVEQSTAAGLYVRGATSSGTRELGATWQNLGKRSLYSVTSNFSTCARSISHARDIYTLHGIRMALDIRTLGTVPAMLMRGARRYPDSDLLRCSFSALNTLQWGFMELHEKAIEPSKGTDVRKALRYGKIDETSSA